MQVWQVLRPYLTTNRSFLVCMADVGGPLNLLFLQSIGDSTNVVSSSYYYIPGFAHTDPPQSILHVRQRAEVTHPPQKVLTVCCAVKDKKDAAGIINGDSIWPQGHGPGCFTVLFVDGYSAYLKSSKWLWDPKLEDGNVGLADDWSSLGWTDFR